MLRPEHPSLLRAMRTSPRRAWFEHVCLAVALLALLGQYSLLLTGGRWWLTAAMVVGLVSLTCAVLRSFGVRWVAPLAIVVELLVLTWVFVPGTTVAGIPTWSSVTALGRLLDRATILILEEPAPTAGTAPVVLVLAASFGLLVAIGDVLLRRRHGPLLLGALLVVVYAVPAMIAGARPDVLFFLVAAGAWLALVPAPAAGRSVLVPSALLGAGALIAAVVLPPALPDISAVAKPWGKPPPQVFGRGINPMLQLGQNLRRNSTAPAAEYTTTLDDPPYLRVAMLRDFTGKTWRPSRTEPGDRFEGRVGVSRGVKVTTERTKVRIRGLRSSMLPVPYPTQDVSGLEGSWTYQRAGQTVRSRTSTTEDQRYTATSLDIRPTAEQMRATTTYVGDSLRSYVELPNDVPGVLGRTARRITSDTSNDYDAALALQEYLRSSGGFSYSETAPVAQDFDGNGLQALATFLKVKQGYCVHFSSAMAVMARELGIPSRIAVGYAPGETVGLGDDGNIYEVTSDDLHAWPELYFEGVGWVGFEPTPGVGDATAFDEPESSTSGGDTDPAAPEGESRIDAQGRNQVQAEQSAQTDQGTPFGRTAVVVGAGAVVLVMLPGAVRRFLRARRLSGRGGVDASWREVVATAADVGAAVPVAATPRAVAGRIAETTAADPAALERLLSAVETARFARPESSVLVVPDAAVNDARTVTRSMLDGATRRARWRATWLPRSLTRR